MTFTFHCKLQTGLRNFVGILSKVAKIFVNHSECVNKISAQKGALYKYPGLNLEVCLPSLFPLAPLCCNECNKMSIIDIRIGGRGGENKSGDNSPNLITKLMRGYYCSVSLGSGENKITRNLKSFYPYVVRLLDHSPLLWLILRSL